VLLAIRHQLIDGNSVNAGRTAVLHDTLICGQNVFSSQDLLE
jgi:hypothetical protein